jgi:hypothetical protein
MEGLPPEIQLLIIERLGALDIFHLQQVCIVFPASHRHLLKYSQTCKSFYKLIQAFDRVIWRKCLQLQCSQNGLFWPSYRKHATSHEFKDACTANFRFRNASRRWEGRSASTIPSALKKLLFDQVPLEEIYLVPGGRFLIILHKFFIQVWSLYPSPLWNAGPAVGLADIRFVPEPLSSVAYANVVNCTKIQLILHGTTKSVSHLSDR